MTFCGFDEEMLAGNNAFLKGMERGVGRIAVEEPTQSIEQRIAKELSEMNAFLTAAATLNNALRRDQLTGLWLYGRGHYLAVQERIGQGTELGQAFVDERAFTHKLLHGIDDQFYTTLNRDVQRMPQLIAWVEYACNEQNPGKT